MTASAVKHKNRSDRVMNNDIKVSVFCLAYNHEKYIRNCLDGFVNQKTSFQYEVLIHDDASTDKTAEIIREYAEKHPEIIKPVFQTENQYSRGGRIITRYLLPRAQGEYFAWCEGDDCWIDENKLQRQVDFLDSHEDFASCYHRVEFHKISENKITVIPQMNESREFTADEIIKRGAIFQLSAAMLRAEKYKNMPECFRAKGFGDVQLFMYSAMCGRCYVLEDVMSMYRHGTAGSYTERFKNSDTEKKIAHEMEYISMLERVNAHYDYKYADAISCITGRLRFNICVFSNDRKGMRRHKGQPYYREYKKELRVDFIKKNLPWLVSIINKGRKLWARIRRTK